MRAMVGVLAVMVPLGAAAQVPQSGPAAPPRAPDGVFTPAPVPQVAPGVPTGNAPSIVPEQIAPPGTTNSAPLAGAPTGEGGAAIVPGGSTQPSPSLSK